MRAISLGDVSRSRFCQVSICPGWRNVDCLSERTLFHDGSHRFRRVSESTLSTPVALPASHCLAPVVTLDAARVFPVNLLCEFENFQLLKVQSYTSVGGASDSSLCPHPIARDQFPRSLSERSGGFVGSAVKDAHSIAKTENYVASLQNVGKGFDSSGDYCSLVRS